MRAVWNGDEWELHLVCKKEIPVEDAPGDKTAGIDLGISNYLTIDYEDGASELYPGNVLKEDKHYFTRREYQTEGENGPSKRARKARQKLSRRKDHFLHTLSKHIVEGCVEEGVGKIAVGDLSDIREDGNGNSRNWGASGTRSCTDGSLAVSRIYSNTRPRNTVSSLTVLTRRTRARRVRVAGRFVTQIVWSAACTSVRRARRR